MDELNNHSQSGGKSPARVRAHRQGAAGAAQEGLSNYVFGKIQPQALPLEEAVLGALMLDREALPLIMDLLRPESFYLEAHQHVYRAIIRLFERSNPVDLLTVTEELRKHGDLDKVGGAYYLVELTNRVASAANIEYHARIVAQKHIQRELIRLSTRTIKDAYEDTTDVFTLLDDAEKGLFSITQNNLSRTFESMGSLSSRVLKQIEEMSKKTSGLTGVPTGFTDLDRLTSGWQPSDLIIIAARPGMGKCLGKGTKVLMYDGTLRAVEEVAPGDLLMGDDSTPRRVLSVARGRENMYWVRQNEAIDYRVNESHVLSLRPGKQAEAVTITVKDFLALDERRRQRYKGYKVAVEFPERSLPLPAYFLGLWLGQGAAGKAEIATADAGIKKYLESFALEHGVATQVYTAGRTAPELTIVHPALAREAPRPDVPGISLHDVLHTVGVLHHKHLPHRYVANSTANRLELLAGLLDARGSYLAASNGYEFTDENETLVRQIKFLADTLGFRTLLTARQLKSRTRWRLQVRGDVERLPLRVQSGQAAPRTGKSDWQTTAIRVEFDQEDEYFGFDIDGNGLFLLEDMTVTHNTSLLLAMALNSAKDFNKPVAMFSLEMASAQLVSRLISMESEIGGSKMRNGKLEDYEWQQLQSTVERLSTVPIFIDDTPGINIFELRAKCRRLKMQHDIQMVIIDYLQLMSGASENNKNSNREQEIAGISRALKGLAKELSVPIIALSQLSRAVETRGGSKRPQLSDLRESGCLTGDTLITDARTGARIPISVLAGRNYPLHFEALGMDDSLKIGPHNVIKAFYSGKKQVFELVMASGRRIKASANHPFYKLEGWTRLDALQVGERLAMPRKITITTPSNLLSDDELILLAHLLGDGCILPRKPYHYTSADWQNIGVVKETARKLFGIESRIIPQENWWHVYLPSPYRLTHGIKHPITNWYEKLGIERVRSYEKRVPDAVFSCDEKRVALFLHHLWATDGNISWISAKAGRSASPAIYYGTTSAVLAEQVQHLLLRLGIQSTIRQTRKGKYRPSYNVWVQGTENQLPFLTRVGCFGDRGNVVAEMRDLLSQRHTNPNLDVVPKEVWRAAVESARLEHGMSWRQVFHNLETSYAGTSPFKNGISRQRLQRIEAVLPNERLAFLANSDIYWDTIKAINPLGIEDVYDATVPGVHNFVANDFVVHNSIEQDADIVAFIYRPEYYQILEDETGQSLKGIAEVIIAKHRHGALDTIKLKFIDQFAKFANLDDPSFSGLPDPLSGPFNPSAPSVISRPSRMNEEDIPF